MKNAKKLSLLLLSLVLLVGIFAFAALADEGATEATVVYPDGSTETVAVENAITPKEFVTEGDAKLYYGAGNTLFKDDATEGWIFTVEGASTALTDLTVTEEMAGKKIIASGADKVYATAKILINEGDYVIWLGNKNYVLAGGEYTSGEETLTARKLAAGTYNLFFYDEASIASFFTTDCSFEIGGVAYTYQDIRSLSRNTVDVVMYEDISVSNITWSLDNNNRPAVTVPSSGSAAGGGSAATVRWDLNGHAVTCTNTSIVDFRSMSLYIYSSKAGANFYSKANDAFIYTNNDGKLILGHNTDFKEGQAYPYANNISFYMKKLNDPMYGGGAYILGGHYYQTESAPYFLRVDQRLYQTRNARFFLQPGSALTGFVSSAAGTYTIKDCEIYTTGAAKLLYTQDSYKNWKNETIVVAACTVNATSCAFYGVTAEYMVPEGHTIAPTINAKSVDNGGTNTFGDAITYNTVTWYDGTVTTYYAKTLEEAKNFVENHPKARKLPEAIELNREYFTVKDPALSIVYDGLNAAVTMDAELTKVYYTITLADGTVTYYTGTDYADKVSAYFNTWAKGATLTLWADVKITSNKTVTSGGGNEYLDLNGFTLTFTASGGSPTLDIGPGKFYLYSSVPGGKVYAPNSKYFTRSNTDGAGYFGERSESQTLYGDNLTVETTLFNGDLYGGGIMICGGTYIQRASSAYSYLICVSRANSTTSQFLGIKNATFIVNKEGSAAIHWINAGFDNIYNCTFISNVSGAKAIENTGSTANASKTPTLRYCDFVNILPVATIKGNKAPVYEGCRFSLKQATTDGLIYKTGSTTEADPRYLARIAPTEYITVGEDSYPINYALVKAGEYLTVEWEDGTHPYWALGSAPVSDTALPDIIEKLDNETYHVTYKRYQYPTGITEVTEALLGTTASELAVQPGVSVIAAFSYQVAGENAEYAPLLDSAEANGEQFASLLNDLSNVKIVMYTDISLSRGVLFGTLKDHEDPKGNTVLVLNKTGDVDWDLNGYTVTVLEGATPLSMVNGSESEGAKAFNCLHYVGNAIFKLYSSLPGGQYINNSAAPIFGAIKYATSAPSYILGTNDLAVNGGDNLTVVSNNSIVFGYENNGDGPAEVLVGINGGTYVYRGTMSALNCGGTIRISNAKVLTTGAAKAVFLNAFWAAKQGFYIENSTVIAQDTTTRFVDQSNTDGITTSKPKVTHTVTIKDVVFAGGDLRTGYGSGHCTFVFEGEIKAPNATGLSAAYPTAPTGKTAAYSSVSVYGVAGKVYSYHDAALGFVTVRIADAEGQELWLAGSEYVFAGALDDGIVLQENGVWYFLTDTAWVGKIDGVAVEDICAAENAGKTVVVAVEGTKNLLYFTYSVGTSTTYYYGDAAKASEDMSALLTALGKTSSQIKLYSDFTLTKDGTQTVRSGGVTHTFDLNGYTFTVATGSDSRYAFIFQQGTMCFYSSREGGVMDVLARDVMCADSQGAAVFGENSSIAAPTYGQNFTMKFKAFNLDDMWGGGFYIVGGTYIQDAENAVSLVFNNKEVSPKAIRNATFIIGNANSMFRSVRFSTAVENCSFIFEKPTVLLTAITGKDAGATFTNCNFYGSIHETVDGIVINYNDCNFDASSLIPQKGGYIAYTGTPVVLNIGGKDYTFGAKLLANDAAALIDWGFGMKEYWAIGATATHADTLVDGIFTYGFKSFVVSSDDNTVVCGLKKIENGAIQMSLTLKSSIRLNLLLSEAVQISALRIGDADYVLEGLEVDENGFYIFQKFIAPNAADKAVDVEIVIGNNTHVLPVSVGAYAKNILADETHKDAHYLTYAMVEYVRAMTTEDFLSDLETIPEDYAVKELVGVAYDKGENVLLDGIRFNLSGTIAIEISAADAAALEGTDVNLVLATGRSEHATMADGSVVFTGLYINEFYGEMTIKVGTETYTYSLANYLDAMAESAEQAVIVALNNYAYHADVYAKAQHAAQQ